MNYIPKFSINKKYYRGTVYEWNLPTGHTCPHAVECLVKVDRETGKFDNESSEYKCYAASAERFPAVRGNRWSNYAFVKNGGIPEIPTKCKSIRIHGAGDFFNQKYFDMWLELARNNPDVEFWAFTKSLNLWIKRIDEIPDNFSLTASYGGKFDKLIEKYNLRWTKVLKRWEVEYVDVPDSPYEWARIISEDDTIYPIDTNDDIPRIKDQCFILLDNIVKGTEIPIKK